MNRISLILLAIFFLVCALFAVVQGWLCVGSVQSVARLEQAGLFSFGWGTGVTAWLLSGHQSTSCLLRKIPAAWKLGRKGVLVSRLPVFKYLVAGLLFAGLGVALVVPLWGLFTPAFDVGLLVGAVFGLVHSVRTAYQSGVDKIDFLDANQRYLSEENVTLFSDKWT